MKAYTFVKNIAGQLRISLETYNMQNAMQDFVIPAGVEKVIVPYQYALGLFVSPSALNQYRAGYFTVEDIESLVADAREYGLVAAQEEKTVLTIKEVAVLLQENNIKQIESLIQRRNPVELANLFTLVRENYDKVPAGILTKIETLCGVELRIDE